MGVPNAFPNIVKIGHLQQAERQSPPKCPNLRLKAGERQPAQMLKYSNAKMLQCSNAKMLKC